MTKNPTHRTSTSRVVYGVVERVDYANRRLRVAVDGNLTDWIAHPVNVARNFVHWQPLAEGQQVMMLVNANDLSHAEIIKTLDTNQDAPASLDSHVDVIEFSSGTTIRHDAKTNGLIIENAASIHLQAELISMVGQIDIKGFINHDGSQASTGDVVADGVSLIDHDHDETGIKTKKPNK